MNEDELDLEGLSGVLAALSVGECPTGFREPVSPFEADDIDWTTNKWLTYVQYVQSWLYLDNDIDLQAGPESAASDLFAALDVENPRDCFVVGPDGVVALTPTGFSLLDKRVGLAQARKDRFDQALDEGASKAQASKEWQAQWEDEPDPSDFGSVQVHAEVDTWKIKEFKDLAAAKMLELNPSYQRDMVWSNSDSQKLLDSVLRGIPLPSIILNKRKKSNIYEIVDGKQRLTAILRFIGQHPEGVRYAKAQSTPEASFDLFRSDYRKWRRLLGIKSPEERRHCLPFPLSSYTGDDPLRSLSGRYYCEIASNEVMIQGESQSVEDVFESPGKVYLIPVIAYKDTDLHQIHRVFGLYNKQGKQLNAEELRNAIYHHLDLTKLLLAIGGDCERPEELVSFAAELSLKTVPDMLHELQVGVSRFHRTKLVSWVATILLHAPKRHDKSITTPSTSGFINGLLDAMTKEARHPMRSQANLQALARAMIGGAALLNELRGEEEAFAPSFTHKKSEGARWDDLPTVSAWTACTLATISGFSPDNAASVCDQVRKTTNARKPLGKQQSRSQWGYIARTVLELLNAMGIDLNNLDAQLNKKLGYSCLTTIRDIDALQIHLG